MGKKPRTTGYQVKRTLTLALSFFLDIGFMFFIILLVLSITAAAAFIFSLVG